MKMLAFVDLHGDLNALSSLKKKIKRENVDLVLCAGDITIFGKKQKEILEKISTFDVPVLIIHGNHELEESLHLDCEKFENIIFLHSASVEINGVSFFGYGGGGFEQEDELFRELTNHIEPMIESTSKKVFLVHGPPFGTLSDWTNKRHVGNKDYIDFILKNRIDLTICGHIHETAGTDEIIENSRIVNPGKSGITIDI